MNKMKPHNLQYGITAGALLIALAYLVWPNLSIDAITITLLFIALVPWLSPIFKSLEFPGGWKIEFKEMKEQLETMIAKQTEPISEAMGPAFSLKAYSVNDESTRLVLKALGNPNYTWRYLGGLADETRLPKQKILESIKWLLENNLVTEAKGKHGRFWGLSSEGRDLLRNILTAEETKKET